VPGEVAHPYSLSTQETNVEKDLELEAGLGYIVKSCLRKIVKISNRL
jgi:hypothetical protein